MEVITVYAVAGGWVKIVIFSRFFFKTRIKIQNTKLKQNLKE